MGGGEYKQLLLSKKYQKANARQIRNIERDLRRILNRNNISATTEKKLKDYYEGYFFPKWTFSGNRSELSVFRKRLFENFGQARESQAFDALLKIVLDNLTPLATSSEYSPAVRFNAAYTLGRLNAKITPSRKPPVACPEAMNVLLPLLKNTNENDAARFGALLGVVRHAQFNNTAKHPEIIDALRKQAMTQTPPAIRSPEGHEWFRATAIEGLAHAKGEEVKKVAPALAKIINDRAEPDAIRLVAANSLGQLPLTPDSGANAAVTIRSLGELAAKIVNKEIEVCEKDVKKTIDASLLMSQLLPIRVALNGPEKKGSSPQGGLAAAAKDKEFFNKVWKLVDDWYDKLDDKELIPDDTIQPDRAMGQELPPARVATEKLIKNLKLQLQKMDNLVGASGNTIN